MRSACAYRPSLSVQAAAYSASTASEVFGPETLACQGRRRGAGLPRTPTARLSKAMQGHRAPRAQSCSSPRASVQTPLRSLDLQRESCFQWSCLSSDECSSTGRGTHRCPLHAHRPRAPSHCCPSSTTSATSACARTHGRPPSQEAPTASTRRSFGRAALERRLPLRL